MRIIRRIDFFLEAITGFLLGSMVALTFLQVFSRYALHAAFDWTEELARLNLIYLTFIGSIVALRRNQLLRLDVVTQKLPLWVRRLFELGVDIVSIVVLGVVVWQGIPLLWKFWPVRSAALDWPTTFFYLPVIIGCFGMVVFTGFNLLGVLPTNSGGHDPTEAVR